MKNILLNENFNTLTSVEKKQFLAYINKTYPNLPANYNIEEGLRRFKYNTREFLVHLGKVNNFPDKLSFKEFLVSTFYLAAYCIFTLGILGLFIFYSKMVFHP